MEVKINITPIEGELILAHNGYEVEEVEVSYNREIFVHGSAMGDDEVCGTYTEKVAYRKGDKPKYLNSKPLIGLDERDKYENVLNMLVKGKFMDLMMSKKVGC